MARFFRKSRLVPTVGVDINNISAVLTQLKTRLAPAFQVMTDVAAVVAAAAGSSRGIGIKGNLVSIISMYLHV